MIYGVYTTELCNIYKKKKYYSNEREGYIEFDVVIELLREGTKEPNLIVIFECKNYSGSIPEEKVREFSDKLSEIAKHKAKGILVVNSKLQYGAKKLLEKRGMGLAKYSKYGIEIILERKNNFWLGTKFIEKQIFGKNNCAKSLKFSAYYDGKFLSSIRELLQWIDECPNIKSKQEKTTQKNLIPFLSYEKIEKQAMELLNNVNYTGKMVNLEEICSYLSINLNFIDEKHKDEQENEILGIANFQRKDINIYLHENKNRERFTIAHEIGHFFLNHCKLLHSDFVIERDLLNIHDKQDNSKYERLEVQANIFASCLLLPKNYFIGKIYEIKEQLNIKNKGFGEIYVDNQRCNLTDYHELLSCLSQYFGVSKQAIEIKLKKLNLLNDARKNTKYNNYVS